MTDKQFSSVSCPSPDVSVILPVYRAEQTLSRCLDSILAQSFQNFEVLCINDASPDGSQHVIDAYLHGAGQIRSLINQSNLGHGASRNRGVKEARGTYIFHVDPDDVIPPHALDTLLQIAQQHDSDMVKGNYLRFNTSEAQGTPANLPVKSIPLINTNLFATESLLHATEGHWSYLYKTAFIRDVPYPEDLRMGPDSLFLVNALIRAQKVSLIGQTVYHYIHNAQSTMNNPTLIKALDMVEWRKRAWNLLRAAGLTHLGNDLLFSYWTEKGLRRLAVALSKEDVFAFFHKFRETVQDLGIITRVHEASPSFVQQFVGLILGGKDNAAYGLLVPSPAPRQQAAFVPPSKVSGLASDAAIQMSWDKAPVIHWNTGQKTSANSVADYEAGNIATRSRKSQFKTSSEEPIRVLTLCSKDSGGAGIGSLRRVRALRAYGLDAWLVCLGVRTAENFVGRLEPALESVVNADQDAIWNIVRHRAMLRAMRQLDFRGTDTFSLSDSVLDFRQLKSVLEGFDVLHLHMGVGMVDYEHMAEVLGDMPVVWTMADMNAFTGGCHYSDGCLGYVRECENCPQLGSKKRLAHETWRIKRKGYVGLNLHFIAPSKWLAEQARQSSLIGHRPIHVISNPFPVDIFQPVEKATARDRLGLPQRKKLILFGADALGNKRKGGVILQQAMEIFSKKYATDDVEVVTFGQGELALNLPVYHLGHIAVDQELALVYSAADVFVLPSLEDNAPLTVGEALLCGTPVVGFRIGYLPDIIQHGTTGYLASPANHEDLARGLDWAVNTAPREVAMSTECRNTALHHHNPESSAMQHNMIYHTLVYSKGQKQTFYVVTPCLNAENTIDTTILSVISQVGDFAIRYHVLDMGSTDNTVDKIKLWRNLIEEKKIFQCQKIEFTWSCHVNETYNKALDEGFFLLNVPSSGLMTWINPGDALLPGALYEIQKEACARNDRQASIHSQVVYEIQRFLRIEGDVHSQPSSNFIFNISYWFKNKSVLFRQGRATDDFFLKTSFRDKTSALLASGSSFLPKMHSSKQIKNISVSVIIPICNAEKYLSACLESVISQNLKNIEIVCVNDCSSDGSAKILEEYAAIDGRFILVNNEENVGPGETRNIGFDHSCGQYIFFLDPDDLLYDDDALKKLLARAEEDRAEMVIGQTMALVRMDDGTYVEQPMHFSHLLEKEKRSINLENNPELLVINTVWNRLITREFLLKNEIRFVPPRYAEDIPFSLYVTFYASCISTLSLPTMKYRRGNYTATATERKCRDAVANQIHKLEFIHNNCNNQIFELAKNIFLDFVAIMLRRQNSANMTLYKQSVSLCKISRCLKKYFKYSAFENYAPWRRAFYQRIWSGQFFEAIKDFYKTDPVMKKSLDPGECAGPLVSVIIPVYDVEQYLRECLDSILSQTLSDLEIICVNDCSPDNAQAILDEYARKDARINVVSLNANVGQGQARNMALEIAKGQYVYFLDPDDKLYGPDSIRALYDLALDSCADVCVGTTVNFKAGSQFKEIANTIFEGLSAKKRTTLNEYPYLANINTVWNILYKKCYLNKFSIRFTKPRYAEDILFSFIAIYFARSIAVTKKKTMFYRIGNQIGGVNKEKILHALLNYKRKLLFAKKNANINVLEVIYNRTIINISNRANRDFVAFADPDEQYGLLEMYNKIVKLIPMHYVMNDNLDWEYLLPLYHGDYASAVRKLTSPAARALKTKISNFSCNCEVSDISVASAACPVVSIIMPVYNVSAFIDECLYSIRNQSLKNIEIICVDDVSQDDSIDKIKKHALEDKRIVVLQHTVNGGLPVARNTGTESSTGKYIYFIDSDDMLYDCNSLLNMYLQAENNRADVVIGGALKYYAEDESVFMPYYKSYLQKYFVLNSPLEFPPVFSSITAWNKLLNRNFLLENKCLYFNPELRGREDNSYTPKVLSKSRKTIIYPFTTYLYRQDKSKSYTEKAYRKFNYKIIAIDELSAFFEENLDCNDVRRYVEKNYASELVNIASTIPRSEIDTQWLYGLLKEFLRIFDNLPLESYNLLPEVVKQAHTLIKNDAMEEAWKILGVKKVNNKQSESLFPLMPHTLRFPNHNFLNVKTPIHNDKDNTIVAKLMSVADDIAKGKYELTDDLRNEFINSFSVKSNYFQIVQYLDNLSHCRLKNRAELEKYEYQIISLGQNCLPRTVLTRWGVKPNKAHGELSMPFDLALHFGVSPAILMESKFKDYFQDATFSAEHDCWVNSSMSIRWNHDKDIGPIDLDKLKKRYQARIVNFYRALQANKLVIFVYSIVREAGIDQVQTAINELRKGLDYRFVVIDHSGKYSAHTGIDYIASPYPGKNYKWSKFPFFSSSHGVEFEKNIVDNVIKVIRSKC